MSAATPEKHSGRNAVQVKRQLRKAINVSEEKCPEGLFSFGEAAKKERGALLFFLTGRAEDAIL
jgi:hypothetical protein